MTIERVVTPSIVSCAKWQLAVKREASNRESWTTISIIDVSLSPDPTESPRASRLVHSHFNYYWRVVTPTLPTTNFSIVAPKTAFDRMDRNWIEACS